MTVENPAARWIKHDGKGCPVGLGDFVHVRCRDGWQDKSGETAGWWASKTEGDADLWDHSRPERDPDLDIVAYRLAARTTGPEPIDHSGGERG